MLMFLLEMEQLLDLTKHKKKICGLLLESVYNLKKITESKLQTQQKGENPTQVDNFHNIRK